MAERKAARNKQADAGVRTDDVVEQKVVAGAADVLDQVNRVATVERPAGATPAVTTARPSRGLVDAPGKRHRKPPPQEQIDKRMGEATGKQMGQKNVKNGMRRGRG